MPAVPQTSTTWSILRGYVSKLLPAPNLDSSSADAPVRLDRYGNLIVSASAATTDYTDADEGSAFTVRTPTIGTGIQLVAAQTSFSDTAPFFYLFNGEDPKNPMAKAIQLRTIKLITTGAMTGGAVINYAFTLDPIPRAITTNYMSWTGGSLQSAVTPLQAQTINMTSSLPANFQLGLQDGGTTNGTVISARSAQATIAARGNLGGLNIAGDIMQIVFGEYDCGASPAATAAEGAGQSGSRVFSEAPLMVPPGFTLVGHLWSASSSASINPEVLIALRAR